MRLVYYKLTMIGTYSAATTVKIILLEANSRGIIVKYC
jgi:hypothetical protein